MSYIEMGGVFMMPMLLIGVVAFVAGLAGAFGVGSLAPHAGKMAAAVRHAAVFLLIMGILSQAMGLYQALSAIEGVGGTVSPALVAGGLKVSFIAPIFGLVEFLVLYVLSAVIRFRMG
ncbi:MAG: hypothetical protein RIE53_00070 [Rhodothermales bacterium]